MGNSVLSSLIARGPTMKTVSLPRGRHRLHCMPTSAGYEVRTDASYNWDGRKRGQSPFSVVQYTIGGAGHLRYENRRYRIVPGETLFLLVPHNHRYWVEDGGRWEFFWISMNGDEALRIQKSIQAATGPVLRLKPQTIETLAGCALSLIDVKGETPGAASAIAYEATMALYDDVFGSSSALPATQTAMRPVVDHILANLDKALGVEQLAAVCNLSRAHFSRQFAQQVGMPPAEFVLQERMRRAAKLLATNGDLPIKEVAAMVGIEDPNYFPKIFRRVFGISPTEFRTTGMYASVSNHLGEADASAVRRLP